MLCSVPYTAQHARSAAVYMICAELTLIEIESRLVITQNQEGCETEGCYLKGTHFFGGIKKIFTIIPGDAGPTACMSWELSPSDAVLPELLCKGPASMYQ